MDENVRRLIAAADEGHRPELAEDLRRVAHDINGALNTLALNIELLDRATAAGSSPAEGARERCLATLRRAVGEIQQVVALRVLPLAGRDADPARGAD